LGVALRSVLVIEDDPITLKLITRILESEGYHVYTASNGAQGVVQFILTPVQVVVLDIFMPLKDGIETLVDLVSVCPEIQVVAISGAFDVAEYDDILADAKRHGAQGILKKPIHRETLLIMVASLIKNAHAPEFMLPIHYKRIWVFHTDSLVANQYAQWIGALDGTSGQVFQNATHLTQQLFDPYLKEESTPGIVLFDKTHAPSGYAEIRAKLAKRTSQSSILLVALETVATELDFGDSHSKCLFQSLAPDETPLSFYELLKKHWVKVMGAPQLPPVKEFQTPAKSRFPISTPLVENAVRLNVVVVDSSPSALTVYRRILEPMVLQYLLFCFESLDHLKSSVSHIPGKIAVCFVDVSLQNHAPTEVIESFRNFDLLKYVPLVLSGPVHLKKDSYKYFQKGANYFIIKPLESQAILGCIQKFSAMNLEAFSKDVEVLVFEKSRIQASQIRSLFIRKGIPLVVIHDQTEILLRLKKYRHNVLIAEADENNPALLTILRIIREDLQLNQIKLILTVQEPSKRFVMELVKLGVLGFVVRPIEPVAFFQTVSALLVRANLHMDQRKHIRIVPPEADGVKAEWWITGQAEETIEAEIENLSIGGLLARTSSEVVTSDWYNCDVEGSIYLPTGGVKFWGRIIFTKASFMGVKFIRFDHNGDDLMCEYIYLNSQFRLPQI
jgi:DNA-binding NtrC family response regulator